MHYRHRFEEKNVNNLGSALQSYLEFEEQLARIGFLSEEYVKQNDMSIILQLVQDMSNQMIVFQRKGVTFTLTPVETSAQDSFRSHPTNFQTNIQPKAIISRLWCNVCDDNHDESNRDVKKRAQERIFGKK